MRYFPAFVDVDRAIVLVVGGGEAAAQKVRLLRKTTARITVVAPILNAELSAMVRLDQVTWEAECFSPRHLGHSRLVFATIGDRVKDAGVAFAARARSIPVNVVDVPQFCTFITPAIVDRDPVLVAIGTEGAAPVLAQKIKGMLEAWLPAQLGGLAMLAAKLRPALARHVTDGRQRRQFWRRFFDGPIAQKFDAGDHAGAQTLALETIQSAGRPNGSRGWLVVVEAGLNDPDLLTFKAARALQQADLIVIEPLVNPAILEVARRDARRIDLSQPHSITTDEIQRLLTDEVARGHAVVCLKGSDPASAALGMTPDLSLQCAPQSSSITRLLHEVA